MSNLREAAQQALEALELAQTDVHWELNSPTRKFLRKAEKNLRAALEQDEKPVAKIRTWHKGGEQNAELWDWDDGIETLPDGEHLLYASAPLRAALEQQAEPVQEPVQVQRNYLVIKNEFYGNPPAPHATWGAAMAAMLDAGVIKGLTISAREAK